MRTKRLIATTTTAAINTINNTTAPPFVAAFLVLIVVLVVDELDELDDVVDRFTVVVVLRVVCVDDSVVAGRVVGLVIGFDEVCVVVGFAMGFAVVVGSVVVVTSSARAEVDAIRKPPIATNVVNKTTTRPPGPEACCIYGFAPLGGT